MKLHTDVTHKTAINAFKNLRQKFTDVHGDKYDYSEVIYRGDSFNIDIRCKEHGIFTKKLVTISRVEGVVCVVELNNLSQELKQQNNL